MILFAILMFLNFTLDNELLLSFRLEMGGVPINALDILLVVFLAERCIVFVLSSERADRIHPLFLWSMILMAASLLFGSLAGMAGNVPMRHFSIAARNLLSVLLATICGYLLVRRSASVRPVVHIWILASVASALAVMILARSQTESIKWGSAFDSLRKIRFGGDAGLVAAGFFVYVTVSRLRFFPLALRALFATIAIAGAFTMPHRGSYLLALATLAFCCLWLPRASKTRRMAFAFVGTPILLGLLVAGASIMSSMTGRDFKTYVIDKRVKAMLPGFQEETKSTVTGSRLPGILLELRWWSESPIFGKGLAYGESKDTEGASLNHNVWSASLAQTGVIGLAAWWVPICGVFIVGLRMRKNTWDPWFAHIGVIGAIMGLIAFLWGTLSLTINQQRLAIVVGLIFGIAFRARALELTIQNEYAGYLDCSEAGYGEDAEMNMDGYDSPVSY